MDENSTDFLRTVYLDILNGFSYYEEENFYIKHINDSESNQVIQKRVHFTEKYNLDGIPTFNQKLEEIINNGTWNKNKEEKIEELKLHIKDNEKNLINIIPYQKPLIQQIIDNKKRELSNILYERKQIMGKVAEDFAIIKSENFFLYLSLYKDSELKIRMFETYKDFENLEDQQIEKYSNIIEKKLSNFKEEIITKISIMPFFLNILSYTKENIFGFFNKPVIQLTPYQFLLFSIGQRNLNILSQTEAEPPLSLDITKIKESIEWYDKQYSIIQGKNSKNPAGITKTSRDIVLNKRN